MSTIKVAENFVKRPDLYILTYDGKKLRTAHRTGLRGIWTWIACKLKFKSYSLQRVIDFVGSEKGQDLLVKCKNPDEKSRCIDNRESLCARLRLNHIKFNSQHKRQVVIDDLIKPIFGLKPVAQNGGAAKPPVPQPPKVELPQNPPKATPPEAQPEDPEKKEYAKTEEIFQNVPKNLSKDYETRVLERLQNSENTLIAFYKGGITAVFSNFYETAIDLTKTLLYSADPTNFLSNVKPSYCSVEAAFQHIKWVLIAFDHQNDGKAAAILNDPNFIALGKAKTSQEAYQLARKLEAAFPKTYANNWLVGRRDAVMWKILQVKFAQGTKLREILEATGDAFLVEHNEANDRDAYWSNGKDGTGDYDIEGNYVGDKLAKKRGALAPNALGAMLMALRDGAEHLPAPLLTEEHMQETQDTIKAAEKFAQDSMKDREGSIFAPLKI